MDDGQEKAPSTKHQAPEKLQAPMHLLLLEIRSFSGAWSLVLGACPGHRLHAGGTESFARRPAPVRRSSMAAAPIEPCRKNGTQRGGEKFQRRAAAEWEKCRSVERAWAGSLSAWACGGRGAIVRQRAQTAIQLRSGLAES